jgi:di/tricarboxylate transporter
LSETELHLVSTIVVLISIVIPVFIAIQLRHSNNRRLRDLMIVLAIFVAVHGIYHIIDFLGFSFLAEWLFEPISIAILIFFGVLYLRTYQTTQEIKK